MSEIVPARIRLIATYARVSTSRQEDEGTIETQISALKEYAGKHNLNIVREYVDEGWSGDILARPGLDTLRQEAKSKVWDAVLIYDPDRLARRYSYQELVMDELREAGIEVMFVTISAPKNSEDKILHGVRGLFAEYERAKITERFRLGKLRKVREGHLLVSEPLYGYDYIPKNDGIHGFYQVKAEEAEVVRKIFAWVADDGLTIRKVIRKLQDAGVRPRKSKRGVWSSSTLSKILRNGAYVGEARWGSTYAVVPENPTNKEKYRKTKKSSRKSKPESEWVVIPVPSIITKELFMRTRLQLQTNAGLCKRNKINEYLLAGKMYCDCGRRRTGEGPQHGKHLYYRCSDRVARFPLVPTCKAAGINARIADKLVWDKVSQLMGSPELLVSQLKRWSQAKSSREKVNAIDLDALDKEIEKLKHQEERYNKAYGAGVFTVEQLKEYVTPLRERIKECEAKVSQGMQHYSEVSNEQVPTKRDLQKFASEARLRLSNLSFEAKRAIVMNTVGKIVGSPQTLKVYGYIPINHVGYKTSDRHCGASERG